ncbi:MAG: 2'-5' RNA ligase family protein [Actinomycetota bacterium]|nr:2'-5' RNA ligase family protein [Actinomycetota bacterium]
MRTVELLGDDGLDRAVRAAWRRLDQAGFSSLAQHRHPTNQPHVTLASAEQFPPGAVAAIADALRVLPILVQLDRLHFFGGRTGMLAWAVDGGSALRELQARVWSALDGMGRNPQHEPGAWTPHISLARRLLPGQMTLAAQAVGETVAGGALSGARSYDSVTRVVIPLP